MSTIFLVNYSRSMYPNSQICAILLFIDHKALYIYLYIDRLYICMHDHTTWEAILACGAWFPQIGMLHLHGNYI